MSDVLEEKIEQQVVTLAERLIERNWSVTTAESCTGGGVAESLTALAGSSAWFNAAFVTYSNAMKSQLLGVKPDALEAHGAVSQVVALQMAEGALASAQANLAVAISGIAGPGGGSPDKPVGTVCFAVAGTSVDTVTETCLFVGDRHQVRLQAVSHALQMLLDKFS